MLLFIVGEKAGYRITTKFQYISCYCLSCSARWNISQCSISIHLMLLFIIALFTAIYKPLKFQYISCYCLSSKYVQTNSGVLEISIHLMLLFIEECEEEFDGQLSFQYISCYCLSQSQETTMEICGDFNISHVTVYLVAIFIRPFLSVISIHLMLLFI